MTQGRWERWQGSGGDGHRHGEETTGKTLKRRGILAAAGAVVAGIVAKQASQPVAAHDANDLGLGSAFTNTASTTTKLGTSAWYRRIRLS